MLSFKDFHFFVFNVLQSPMIVSLGSGESCWVLDALG